MRKCDGWPRFLCLTGPTTTGKTALSLAVAERLGGEIVSMDSRQVYRGMDIGTDKVGLPDRARAPHHGLDRVDPDGTYSAGQFARDARRWIEDIRSRGRIPILAGGTGFFLRAVVQPIFREPPQDRERRAALRAELATWSVDELARWVERLDPSRAALAREGGRQRLGRTLEVALLTGRPLSWWHAHAEPEAPPEPGLTIVLELPRDRIDENIRARVLRMVDRGLLHEVRRLLEAGFDRSAPGMTGTGYREIARHLAGDMTLDDALEAMERQTRQYARRQQTWGRNQLADAPRLAADRALERQVDEVVALWQDARAEVPA